MQFQKIFSALRVLAFNVPKLHVVNLSNIKAKEDMDLSRFYENPYPEYPTNLEKFLSGNQLKDDLISKVKSLDQKLLIRLANLKKSDYSMYTGYTGVAYLYLLKYKKTNDQSYLIKALELTEQSLGSLKGRDLSFLLGDAGPLALATVIYYKLGKKEATENLIKRLLSLPQIARDPPYEVLYGHAGFLYALLFINKELGPVIPSEPIKKAIETIINAGSLKAKSSRFLAPLFYEWYDTNYLGAAHGVSGILYILLCANDYLSEADRKNLIRPTIDWLTTNRFPSGNFKSSEGRDRDALVHWCHGCPGVVYLYLLASKVFNDDKYMQLALECGDVVWNRGLLRKGYSICYGVSGNAYTFIHLYKETKDEKHLYRAACFADWCTRYPEAEGHKPDSPLSLFEGIAGLDYFLTDIQDPLNAAFPAYALD